MRFDMRASAFVASALGIGAALLIAWFAVSNSAETRRLIAHGVVADGIYDGQRSQSSGGKTCFENRISYKVASRTYHISGICNATDGQEALDVPEIVVSSRLGPERPDQVVYLPSDPSVARLRSEITLDLVPYYGTGGMFLLIGLVFGFAGLVLLKPRSRKD
jgi:hypothetical protein